MPASQNPPAQQVTRPIQPYEAPIQDKDGRITIEWRTYFDRLNEYLDYLEKPSPNTP